MNKKIEITTISTTEIAEMLELNNTVLIFDMIEDLSEVIEYLGTSSEVTPGLIPTVARVQRLLIDICRLKTE